MKKKWLSGLLAVACATALLTGCSGSSGTNESSSSDSTSSSVSTAESSEDSSLASETSEAVTDSSTSSGSSDESVVYVDPFSSEDGLPYTATEASSGKTFGVSVQTHANAFFLAEIQGVKDTLAKGNIDAEVLSPDPANDINTQVEDITEMVARGVDVILVDALDKDGIKPALEEADRAGIPVIAIDSNVEDKDLLATLIESDNTAMGKMAGETLCEAIGGEGQIVVINWSTLQCVRERVEGLKSVIEESYPNVEIVADQDAFGVVEDAQSIMESFLQTYPDLKGVFAINSPTAQGATAAIKAAGLEGQIKVVDIDGAQNDIDMIKEGQILCSPVQFPATIANKAVECAELIWSGKEDEVASHYYVQGDNITEENLDQYDGKTY